MTIKNCPLIRLRISRQKFNLIIRSFSTDITALDCAEIVQVNRKTVDRFYNYFRDLVIQNQHQEREQFLSQEETEVDESYFGPSRVRGKRGRGAGKKVAVVGLLQRKGKVFTKPVDRCTKEELLPILLKRIALGTDIFTDGWKSYDGLAIYGYNHKQVKHHEDEFSQGDGNHINGMESFWSYAKRRLAKFNGILKRFFARYLLETEWRFNHRGKIETRLHKLIKADLLKRNKVVR